MMHTLDDVLMKGAPASSLQTTYEDQRALYSKGALHLRMTDDHDEFRAVTRYGFPGAIAASAVAMTLDGVPLIYNGMEVGDSTQSRAPALFEAPKIFWQAADWHPEYPKFYAALDDLRKKHAALQQGQTIWLHNSDERHVLSYIRRAGDEEFLIVANLSNTPFRGSVEVAAGNWTEISLPLADAGQNALPALSVDAFKFRIFQRQIP
jgi:glycosidase